MMPIVRRQPAVTTVHDLLHEIHPSFFSLSERIYRAAAYGWTRRNSRLLITDSDFSRTSILDRWSLPPERVRVVHLGVDHETFLPSEKKRGNFLLYPANRWPHKNHVTLFEAFAVLRKRNPGLRLVLTGIDHEGKPAPDGVEVRGRVPLQELVDLYQTAAVLVFPSLFEGFGLPVLEAMACGCPVAASGTTSLPELCGDAAASFDPRSPAEMVVAVESLLWDPAPFVAKGFVQAKLFTWDACARGHEEAYRAAVSF
jgi:glycosyltransferase involved in cell wall biosynthesis